MINKQRFILSFNGGGTYAIESLRRKGNKIFCDYITKPLAEYKGFVAKGKEKSVLVTSEELAEFVMKKILETDAKIIRLPEPFEAPKLWIKINDNSLQYGMFLPNEEAENRAREILQKEKEQ